MGERHTPGECQKDRCRMQHSFQAAADLNMTDSMAAETGRERLAMVRREARVTAAGSVSTGLLRSLLSDVYAEFARYDARIAGLQADNDGLKAELDRAGGHDVYVCMQRDLATTQSQLPGIEAGTRIRTTDTHRTYELDEDGHWQELVP